MLDIVRDAPGLSVGELAAHFDISGVAIMNHLAVLSDTNLIVSEKDGRKRRLYLNAAPLHRIHERWKDAFGAYWARRMTTVKAAAELAEERS